MKRYLVTGASGYIGRHIVERLITENATEKVEYILPVRSEEKRNQILREVRCGDNITLSPIVCSSISEVLEGKRVVIDYIIHCAAPTSSSYIVKHPTETYNAIVESTRELISIAAERECKKMIFLSSMEVYGEVVDDGMRRREEELGILDESMPRSSYPRGKRYAETLCREAFKRRGVPIVVARLAQVFGNKPRVDDNRVYMQFAKAAINGEAIELKTKGLSMVNCLDIDEVVEGIILLLNEGEDGEIYNLVNESNSMTVADMAQKVAEQVAPMVCGHKIEVITNEMDRKETGFPKDTCLLMSGEKMRKIGFIPQKSIVEMYKELCDSIKDGDLI